MAQQFGNPNDWNADGGANAQGNYAPEKIITSVPNNAPTHSLPTGHIDVVPNNAPTHSLPEGSIGVVPNEAPTHSLPTGHINVVPNNAPTHSLPEGSIGVVPNEAPTHSLPTGHIDVVPNNAPTHSLPEGSIGVVPNEAPSLELPKGKIKVDESGMPPPPVHREPIIGVETNDVPDPNVSTPGIPATEANKDGEVTVDGKTPPTKKDTPDLPPPVIIESTEEEVTTPGTPTYKSGPPPEVIPPTLNKISRVNFNNLDVGSNSVTNTNQIVTQAPNEHQNKVITSGSVVYGKNTEGAKNSRTDVVIATELQHKTDVNSKNTYSVGLSGSSGGEIAAKAKWDHQINDKVSAYTGVKIATDLHKEEGIAKQEGSAFAGITYQPNKDKNTRYYAELATQIGKVQNQTKENYDSYKSVSAEIGANFQLDEKGKHFLKTGVGYTFGNNRVNSSLSANVGYEHRWGQGFDHSSVPDRPAPVAFVPQVRTVTTDIEEKGFTLQADTLFAHNRAELKQPVATGKLGELSRFLNDPKVMKDGGTLYQALQQDGKKLTISGHTDYTGKEEYNMNLSRNRANNVENYLATEAQRLGNGNVRGLIRSVGKGETEVEFPEHSISDKLKANKQELHDFIQSDRKVVITAEPFSKQMYAKLDTNYVEQTYPSLAKHFLIQRTSLSQTFETTKEGGEKIVNESSSVFVPTMPTTASSVANVHDEPENKNNKFTLK